MDWMTIQDRARPDQHGLQKRTPHTAVPQQKPHDTGPERLIGKSAHSGDRSNAPASSPLRCLFERKGFQQHFQPNSTILLHGDTADAIYLVESGLIRCCTIDDHGTRQIFSFAHKGTYVGVSDFDRWHFTAEAVDHVIVKSVPRAVLEQELAVNIPMRQEIRAHMRDLLAQREDQLLTLVHANGPERLFRFLEGFAATRPGTGYVALPMCRRDIGDHIGLSTESVSRAFSYLKQNGLIDLKSHEKFRITDSSGKTSARDVKPIHA